MQIFLFFALFISVLAVIFAVQNTNPTIVTFAIWKFNGSLALVLLVALAAGALISFFVSLPTNLKTRWTIRQQRKKLTELETNLSDLRKQLEDAQKKIEEASKPVQLAPGQADSGELTKGEPTSDNDPLLETQGTKSILP